MRRYVAKCEISYQSQELVSIAIVPVIKHDEVWMPEHCFYGALDVPDERLDDWTTGCGRTSSPSCLPHGSREAHCVAG